MRILFIDDDPESVRDALDAIDDNVDGAELLIDNFEQGLDNIELTSPDVVVLDVWQGEPQESDPFGLGIMERIWSRNFCPVVVYSADSKIISDVPEYHHPFIQIVQKGTDSDLEVQTAVEGFQPHVAALRQIHVLTSRAVSQAMQYVAPDAFDTFSDTDEISDAILRAGRRRVAALMDETSSDGIAMAAWEQYLCPPVAEGNRLGDVLKLKDSVDENPASFRVVLTPSCDLVSGREKVDFVLVAKCCDIGHALEKLQIPVNKSRIKRSHILSRGFAEEYVIFPELTRRIPPMAVNLKDLQLIPVNNIDTEDPEFETVASIDSPFRELVSWAYLQVAGRPGLPDRDLNAWVDEIIAAVQQPVTENQS